MNRLFFFLFACVLLLCASCESSDAGAVLQPEEDKMDVRTASFALTSSTERLADRHSESAKVELGYLIDPVFGSFKMDYLAEFRYVRDTIPASATNAKLQVVMYYRSFYGDSLSVNEAFVYALQNPLLFETYYTTNVRVADYCDKSVLLGQKAYVPYDATVSDSLRATTGYCDKVIVDLPDAYCQDLLTNRSYLKNQDAFLDFLKGVYVTNSYGSKAVLNVDSVNLEMRYQYAPDMAKPDSLVDALRIYPVNRETSSMVRVSDVEAPAGVEQDSVRYIVAPSGYAMRVTLPLAALKDTLRKDNPDEKLNINHASLVVEEALIQDPIPSSMTPPNYLMLIREKDMDAFFTQSKYPADNIQTVLGVYVASERRYTFNNMAGYLETLLSSEEDLDAVNDFFVLPVSGVTDIAGTDAVVRHLFRPYAVRVRSEENANSAFRLAVTFSNL